VLHSQQTIGQITLTEVFKILMKTFIFLTCILYFTGNASETVTVATQKGASNCTQKQSPAQTHASPQGETIIIIN
jgi:hypothetical protein